MPFVSIKITREPRASAAQKAEVIKQVTEVLVEVLGKDPDTTFVVIEEIELENWGIGGVPTDVWRARQES